MIAIIPFLPLENESFWASEIGKSVFAHSVKTAVAAKSVDQVYVFSQPDACIPLPKPFSVEVVHVDVSGDHMNGGLLLDATKLVNMGLQRLSLPDDTNVIVVGHRNPSLAPSDVDDIFQTYIASGSVQVSIREVEDNPVQLFTTCTSLEGGLIYLFEDDPGSIAELTTLVAKIGSTQFAGRIKHISRPVALRRVAKSTAAYPALLCMRMNSNGISTYSDVLTESEFPCDESVLWLAESEDSVRAIFFETQPVVENSRTGTIIGSSGNWGIGGVKLYRNDTQILLRVELQVGLDTHIRLMPLSGKENEKVRVYPAATKPTQIEPDIVDANIGGIAFSVMHTGRLYDYDFKEEFPHEPSLWEPVNVYGVKKNTITGDTIHGRQQFPTVYEPDGTLLVGRLGQVIHFENLWSVGDVKGFHLPVERQTFVSNEIDFLRHECSQGLREHDDNA